MIKIGNELSNIIDLEALSTFLFNCFVIKYSTGYLSQKITLRKVRTYQGLKIKKVPEQLLECKEKKPVNVLLK